MVFPAQRDWCLQTIAHLLLLGLIGCMLAAGFGIFLRDPSAIHLAPFALWTIYAVVYLARFFCTRYEITETDLIVREGFHRRTIALDRIFEVAPTRGGFIGAAWSRDALKIRFVRERTASDSIIVSPRYKAGFLSELTARRPGLQPHGEGLQRVTGV